MSWSCWHAGRPILYENDARAGVLRTFRVYFVYTLYMYRTESDDSMAWKAFKVQASMSYTKFSDGLQTRTVSS